MKKPGERGTIHSAWRSTVSSLHPGLPGSLPLALRSEAPHSWRWIHPPISDHRLHNVPKSKAATLASGSEGDQPPEG